MSAIDFPAWLQNELNKKGWRSTDLAKQSRISDAAISRILRSERKADAETLSSFAHALNISPITIFRKAGLLPEGGDAVRFEDWQYLLEQLSPEDQEEMRQVALLKIERHKKAEGLKTLKPKRIGG